MIIYKEFIMNKNEKAMGQIIAKCWEDAEFKERFKTEPEAVLKEYGIEVQEGIKYTVIENAKDEAVIVIPPQMDELNDEELDSVAGANVIDFCGSSSSCGFCASNSCLCASSSCAN